VRTPLGFIADHFELPSRTLRWATTAALIVSVIIVFTGGLVRVTASGLGCPDWPTCDGNSLTTTPELGIHGVIEFANRLLTSVIIVAVGWVIVAARLQRPRIRPIERLAWSQFWLIIANALAGGVSVIAKLNPWVVALHFTLAMALLVTTTLTWHRVHERLDIDPTRLSALPRALARALVASSAALILAGTLVSGTGPHSGDSSKVPRMPLDWAGITVVHGILGALVLALGVLLAFSLGSTDRDRLVRRRTIVFLVVVLAQGGIGTAQALLGLPESLVALHLLGAALVWVGVLRVLLDSDAELFRSVRH
jgi:cytochrome c oxidase assembly protein subunit 15